MDNQSYSFYILYKLLSICIMYATFLKFFKENYVKMPLLDVLSIDKLFCAPAYELLYSKNYAATFTRNINICSKIQAILMILATAIARQMQDRQIDRNTEPKIFSSLKLPWTPTLLAFRQIIIYIY